MLDLDTVEAFIFGPNTTSNRLNLMHGGTAVDRDAYVYPSGLVDAVAVGQHFDDGCAIVLPRAHESIGSLAGLVRGLEAELGCRAQTNVYLAPMGASAFVPHHDAHDVFALQAHGSKRWTLYEGPGPDRPTRAFDPATDHPGRVRMSFETHQGDTCYLPKGLMHDAVSEGLSLHVTVGIHWLRVSEVLRTLLQRVIDEQPDLHRVVPERWWLPGEGQAGTVAQTQAALTALLDERLIEDCLRYLREDLVATRQPLVPGQLQQLARLDEIDAQTIVAPRDPMLRDYVVEDGVPRLSCFGTDIRFPAAAADAVDALLHAGSGGTTVDQVDADLSEEEVLVIVRRLIREGVLVARW